MSKYNKFTKKRVGLKSKGIRKDHLRMSKKVEFWVKFIVVDVFPMEIMVGVLLPSVGKRVL